MSTTTLAESTTSKPEVTSQPQSTPPPLPVPQLAESVPLVPLSLASNQDGAEKATTHLKLVKPVKPRRPSRVRPFLRSFFGTTLAILKIIFVYGIPGLIFVTLAFALCLALPFAMITAQGAATMVIGNAILKASQYSHYTTNALAAATGASGACIAGLIIGMVTQCLPSWMTQRQRSTPYMANNDPFGMQQQQEQPDVPWYTSLVATTLVSTLGAVIGCAILLHNHHDLKGLDTLHAARAGALGGAVLGVGMILIGPIILLAIGIVLSPLWVAMLFGFKWVFAHSNESWSQRGNWSTHSSSYCYCYGLCGEDEEIEHEIDQIHRHYP